MFNKNIKILLLTKYHTIFLILLELNYIQYCLKNTNYFTNIISRLIKFEMQVLLNNFTYAQRDDHISGFVSLHVSRT
jgi:hypothetical protein